MNYIKQMNSFLSQLPRLSPRAVVVWLNLFEIANREGWPKYVLMTDRELARRCGVVNRNVIINARQELIKSTMIDYYPSHQRGVPSRYVLRKLYEVGDGNQASDLPISD